MDKLAYARSILAKDGFVELARRSTLYILNISFISPLLQSVIGDVLKEKIEHSLKTGYWPNIRNPRSFNEHILHRKLFTDNDLYSTVADKWAVREYVRDRIGDEILNEVYHVTDDPSTIPFADLPNEFVIKPTHSSGRTIIVDEKESRNYEAIRSTCEKWLSHDFGEQKNEYWYSDIPPQIIIERRLPAEDGEVPLDYKFFTFNGRVELIDVDSDRYSEHKIRFFDRQWEPQDFRFCGYPLGDIVEQPERLDEMIKMAEDLAAEFEFARVDLYYTEDDEIIFGEITLAPEAGYGRFEPIKKDFEIGEFWNEI
jgi:hypothetical protein